MLDEKYCVPTHLDDPPRWLFWTIDEAAALLAPLVLGILLFNQTLFGFMTGIIAMVLVKKLKGSEGHNYLLRLVYWHLPSQLLNLKDTPPSYIREYLG